MKSYGMSFDGNLVIEITDTLPTFDASQIGRFLFVENTESYWLGGLNKWLTVGIYTKTIKVSHIDWGSDYDQVNARHIPYDDYVYRYINATNVHDALIELAKGNGIYDNCITSRQLSEECIYNRHIKWGMDEDEISAEDLVYKCDYHGLTDIINISDGLLRLERNSAITIRRQISPSAWSSVPAEGLYRIAIVTLPIDNPFVCVQCYTMSGELIYPAKITTDLDTSRVYIWMPEPISMVAVVVG